MTFKKAMVEDVKIWKLQDTLLPYHRYIDRSLCNPSCLATAKSFLGSFWYKNAAQEAKFLSSFLLLLPFLVYQQIP